MTNLNSANDAPTPKFKLHVALTRFAVQRSSAALALALLAAVACSALVWTAAQRGLLPLFSLAPKEDVKLGDEPVVKESYFAIIGDDPQVVEEGLESVANHIEKDSRTLSLSRWGLDENSLVKKRLYLLSNEETLELSDDLETARQLAFGRWDYLSAEAFLRRFEAHIRSEMTQERLAGIDAATPFVEALAQTTAPDRLGEEAQPVASPVAPGALKYVNAALDRRYFLSDDSLRGVVAAAWDKDAPRKETLAELQGIFEEARAAFPDLTIELDCPEVARQVALNSAIQIWARAVTLTAVVALCVGWLVFGSLKRSVAVLCAALIAGTPAFCVVFTFGTPTLTKLANAILIFAFAYYWSAALFARYASIRLVNRSTGESILEAFQELGGKLLTYALIFGVASLACLFVREQEARELGLSSALGLPIVAFFLILVEPTLIRLADGANPFRQPPVPLRIEETTSSLSRAKSVIYVAAVTLVVAFVFGVSRIEFSENLSHFLPGELSEIYRGESVAEISGKRVLYAVSFAESPDELDLLKARYGSQPTFVIDDMLARLPKATLEKRRTIEMTSDFLDQLPMELGEAPTPAQSSLIDALVCLGEAIEPSQCACVDEEKRLRLKDALQRAQTQIASFTPSEYQARLDTFESWTTVETVKRLYELRALTNSEKPTPNDLSPEIRARYFADVSERPAVFVYSTADLRDFNALKAFAENVRAVDSNAMGSALALYDARINASRSAAYAFALAIAAGSLLLAFRYRAAADLVAELVPSLFCLAGALGLAGLISLPLTCVSLFCLGAMAPAIGASNAFRSKDAVFVSAAAALAGSVALTASGAPNWEYVGKFIALTALAWFVSTLFRAEQEELELESEV
jgi:hypothetical protein